MIDKSNWTYLEKLIDQTMDTEGNLITAQQILEGAHDDDFETAYKSHLEAEIEHRINRRRIKLYVRKMAKTEL